ncbi:MAG TPA: RecQ family ATP-dependent DNA helicase [Ktedonobacteraceae bacterium]|nr:RecQ family ATP-dependent DNA helicase [Ktedonobacteraceae bacterium]
MTLKEHIAAAAETLLAEAPAGLTAEALTSQVAKQVKRQLPPAQVTAVLRELPQRFVESDGGRWQLRRQEALLFPDEPAVAAAPSPASRQPLRRGCYVVFDLEATRPDATQPSTEIIQIAARRWIDGVPQEPWASFSRPTVPIPEHIIRLTQITNEEVQNAPPIAEVLRDFFAYAGDLPLIAHNGASYDGPLLKATCERLGIPLPPSFRVLDTLPLARVLLPCARAHRVGTLAEYYGCAREDAHRADADVEMLGGIIRGLEREIQEGPTGAAVYELLRRAGDPWAEVLSPPSRPALVPEIIATFGNNITPRLSERGPATLGPLDDSQVESAFVRAEELGHSRREAQIEMSRLVTEALRSGSYAVLQAGTGTGKTQGYLVPAALYARATGRPVAVSTFTRLLQQQLVEREVPFVQQLVPGVSAAQLQGRANYLSLSRLSEEIEDAFSEENLSAPRAWMLATLVRFAEASTHGNLEELGLTPQALDDYLQAEGSVLQTLASVRASRDDTPFGSARVDFYQRARENAERADLVVVNHALLFAHSLDEDAADVPFAGAVICDEAHNLEDAASGALEQRIEERVLRRVLRAIHDPRGGSGLVRDCQRRLGLPASDPTLVTIARAVDDVHAALDSLATRLHHYVMGQTVVSRSDLERYGVRVRIDAAALQAAGGPALRTAATSLNHSLSTLRDALATLIERLPALSSEASGGARETRRMLRTVRLARSLLRDVRAVSEHAAWFWSFKNTGAYVRVVELGRMESSARAATPGASQRRAPITLSAVPINVGPLLWERLWSRLDTAICTSATLSVYGQGFDFFLSRIGLEHERVENAAQPGTVIARELPPAFNYHDQALLMLPNHLPAPRDSELKRNFPEAVADLLRRFIPFFGGKTLALFTANSRRDYVYERLADDLSERGFPVLCQGQGSMERLLDEFRAIEESTLLGSRSLWEGVDVPGPSLSYVFLEKLPYPNLSDPVEAARMSAIEQAGGNAFYDYLLPKMIITLKQGFGRLIRAADDRGAAVLLDKRLRSSLYRTEVLRSLPDPAIGYESDVELFRRIADHMRLAFDPAELPAPTVPNLHRVLAEQQLPGPFVDEADFERLARPRLLAVQQAIWGQSSFRFGQEEIMRDVLEGRDVLTLLPTGAGKSRTYQLPALIRPGLTLVISPLIALIRDQVEKLREVPGMSLVAALVSGMDAASQEEVLRDAAAGRLKLLYVSPERLRDPRFRAYLERLPLVQLVVDEAHCISTWGHDFRPDFLEIARLLPRSGSGRALPIHALTATATRQVQQEIINILGMGQESPGGRTLAIRSGDFVRDNLVFRVYSVARREERDTLALGIVHQLVRDEVRGGSGIVYVATRKAATQFARLLRQRNIAAQAYHGGLPTPERHQIQEQFMQGELDVVVATTAFGMGVDKAEIRFVLHYDHPASLEAYAQEAGRAGRDGKEAYAILLYHGQTQRTERFIAQQGVPKPRVLRRYQEALLSVDEEGLSAVHLADGTLLCDPDALADLARVEPTQARVLLFSFEEAGLVERGPDCTLEATILLNYPIAEAVAALQDPTERRLAETLLRSLGAEPDRQVSYRAAQVYEQTGIDPRTVDPILVKLAERETLLYRVYQRGVTLRLHPNLSDATYLQRIEQGFASRYQRFEERLTAMIDYMKLRPGNRHCRSAALINYLTGRDDAPLCGKCDLCSPTNEHLPWDPGVRLYGEPLAIDIRLAVLGAVRDHNGIFAPKTIEKMLLGIPQTNYQGQVFRLSPAARASDHFGELEGTGARPERVGRTIEALVEGGYLQLVERTIPAKGVTYPAVAITQRGRDALAGGVPLPEFPETEVE